MEGLKLDNKKAVNNYQPSPTLNYDIEGKLLEKNGKNVVVGKEINGQVVEYAVRLKEDLDAKVGDLVKIEKENILSSKIEDKKNKEEISDENSKTKEEILLELGLEFSRENLKMVEMLLRTGIKLTKGNVDSYVKSKEYLTNIIDNIDSDSYVKLINQGVDLGEENLKDISDALDRVKESGETFSIKKFLKLERKLDYKEAEVISKEIYGQRMGKDVYDTIISLHSEGVEINKDTIEEALDVIKKLKSLKDVQADTYVKLIEEDGQFTIDNLYKIENDYTKNSIAGNVNAKIFEQGTIVKETNAESLKQVLKSLEIEDSVENLNIARSFVLSDLDINNSDFDRVIKMKESLDEIKNLLDEKQIAKLIKEGISPAKEDIDYLIEALENKNIISDKLPMDSLKREEILKDLLSVGTIKDEDLLKLIKTGMDLNLDSIKEIVDTNLPKTLDIEYKTLDKTMELNSMFKFIDGKVGQGLFSTAMSQNENISIKNLYDTGKNLDKIATEKSVINQAEIDYMYGEYLKAKNSLSTNIIKESIKDGSIIEKLPIPDLNKYVEKKINRYKEIEEITKGIKSIKENRDMILPIIAKNDLAMTISEIKDLNEFLNGTKGMVKTLESMEKNGNYPESLKEGIKNLKKTISNSVKEGNDSVKYDYVQLLNQMDGSGQPKGEKNYESDEDKYLKYLKKISKRDSILQLPVELGANYSDLNLIIPDKGKKIDKNNMNFLVSLNAENLGLVGVDLNIVGKDIQISLDEREDKLYDNISILGDKLAKLGYTLKVREF